MNYFSFTANPACQFDAEIGDYIVANPEGDFSRVLKTDQRWQIFRNLSSRTAGLLCWYPFREDASILQIGGGFGTLTGLFCDRCRSVTVLERDAYRTECIRKRWFNKKNLRVLNGDLSVITPVSSYDYIVLIADSDSISHLFSVQGYVSLIRRIKELLNPGGKFLFTISNRMGIQYFCGAPDPCTGIPFDGLNNYPSGASIPSLSKPELLDVLNQAGFPKVKLYYIFPDHILPQVIYTDGYPPGEELNERLRPYQANQDSLVIDANMLYDPLISSGLMSFFSNSLLAECSDEMLCNVLFATVSTERGENESFSTVILDDMQVEKRPLYSGGMQGLERLYNNLNDLHVREIPVISCALENNRLVMPRIFSSKLSNHLKKIITQNHDKDSFFACLDKLYKYILQSSEHVAAEKNVLAKLNPDANWGPVLRKAYIEMIPANCFYRDGEFLFFDQEFVRKNYPASYVMFRAVSDIYNFTPTLEQYVSLREIQERYGLTELWPFLIQEENLFQDRLRQFKKYPQFYKWLSTDKKNIMRNGRVLLMNEKPGRIQVKTQERVFAAVEGAEGKIIVLFGAGRMMDHYIRKYGIKYPPAFVVDNDESKWNTEKLGFSIMSPQVLYELTPGQYRVIICNGSYDEIAKQLQRMGIKDFRIYVRTFDEMLENVEVRQNPNEKYNIGYVTGVFDLFHIGHLNILRKCKERCEYLIAGVLTDELAERDKGKRPFIPFEERLAIVQQIKYVDRVIPVNFHNTDKMEAWKQLHYDCHFAGTDHEEGDYWLKRQLQTVGSNVEHFPYTESTSSTKLKQMIDKALI